jgi:predicted nucleic acid-binding protein
MLRKARTGTALWGRKNLRHLDASVAVAALIDTGADGRWAQSLLAEQLAAPHLVLVEVANVLRRAAANGQVTDDAATLAHADLLALRLDLVPYDVVGERIWQLRGNVGSSDAWYVAVAELLDAPLATLDRRLAAAPGPRCEFLTP